jgi:hypothetical protein
MKENPNDVLMKTINTNHKDNWHASSMPIS